MDKPSILIVEDEPIARDILKAMLLRIGAGCVVDCSNAASALEVFKGQRFDIVMLDLELPDRNGHVLMQDFRALRESQHMVLVTADDSLESVQRAIAAGANGYVVKPFSEEKIQDVISNYIVLKWSTHR